MAFAPSLPYLAKQWYQGISLALVVVHIHKKNFACWENGFKCEVLEQFKL